MWHRVEERVASFASENFLFPLSLVFSNERRKSSKSPHAWDPDFYFILFYFILFYFILFFFSFSFFSLFALWWGQRDSSRRDTLELILFLVVFTPMSSGFRRHRPALTASRRPQCRLGATYWETEAVGPLPPHRPFFFFFFWSLNERLRGGPLPLRLGCVAVFLIARSRRSAAQSRRPSIDLAVYETGIWVPVHQSVDLQLGLVEGVRRWLHHVTVHYFAHSRVQTHLKIAGVC